MHWLTFVGEGRSGHTIVSAILGSHPHVRLAEEQKYISKWCRGKTKDEIMKLLMISGVGRYRKTMGAEGILEHKNPLLLVGDKCGWDAVNEVKNRGQDSDILTRFSKAMGMPVKVIHTTRHPLDNITAWVDSPKYERIHPTVDRRFNKMIARYTKFYEKAEQIMEGQDVFHLRNEDLIANPSTTLQRVSDWLELPKNDVWVRTGAKLVSPRPHRCRDEYPWPSKYTEQVLTWRVLDRFPSLSYYRE